MPNQQYETANITYRGLEDKGLTVTLIDDKKGKWSIWKKGYQSNDDSEPYVALQNFKFGDTFGVSYLTKDEEFTGKDGKQIKFKRKTIYSILPVITNPTSELKPIRTQNPASTAPITYQTDKDTDWDKIAVGKCATVFLGAYIQSGKSFADAKLQVTAAKQLAELLVYGTQKTIKDDSAELARDLNNIEPLPTEAPPFDDSITENAPPF